MSNYIVSILYGIVVFPIVALLITLPYMIFQYRKYGSIPPIRVLIIYSFILYLICSYFLVILPLPSKSYVMELKMAHYQLIPFNFIIDFIKTTSFDITNIHTYLSVIKEPIFYQAVYNTILFIPLGIYLSYYFKCNLTKTILYSFILSLFFELTQLTGLYYIYPRNYRLFDVDDLIINTLGGFIGYYIGKVIIKILPSRDEIDNIAYIEGNTIPLFRRLFAFLLDYFIFSIFSVICFIIINSFIKVNYSLIYDICLILYYIIFCYLAKGYTIGKKFFKIKIVSLEGKLDINQIIIRYGLLYFILFKIPNLLKYDFFVKIIKSRNESIYLFMSIILFILIYYLFKTLNNIKDGKLLFYEKLSQTKNINMIKFRE